MNFRIVCAKIPTRMSKIDPKLEAAAKTNPDDSFRVIVRVEGNLDTCAGQLEAIGFTITRRLRLVRGFGAGADGAAILKAASKDWIVSIETDGQVHTMKDKKT